MNDTTEDQEKQISLEEKQRKDAQEVMDALGNYVNYRKSTKSFIEAFKREHNTLQQSAFRMFLELMEDMASENYQTDGRNEDSKKMAQMKIDRLEREVKESYSSEYLEKYFKAKVVDLPNLDVVNKIVTTYGDWLHRTVCGENDDKWYQRVKVIKEKDLTHIEKDMEMINAFMEFLTENNAI